MKIPTSITIVLTSIVWLILLYFSLIYHDSERDKELKTISRNLGEDTYRCAILEYNIQFKDSINFIAIDSIADRINFKNGY